MSACGPKLDHYEALDEHLYRSDYESALTLIEENKETYRQRNEVLYFMEDGILAHFAGRYEESNRSLLMAEQLLEKLYTRSVSREAASFIINDNTTAYRGEDFENAMVNVFLALNYIGLGKMDDALVEARKVDIELNLINARYGNERPNTYSEDAFIRFLMGVLYEAGGEINDAFISYRKAEEIYRNSYSHDYGVSAPRFVVENLLGAAASLGFQNEIVEILTHYPDMRYPSSKNDIGEVYLIHYNGRGPEKVEEQWVVPMPDGFIVKVSYPRFVHRPYQISHGIVRLQDLASSATYEARTELMEDIGAIATKNLENRLDRIKAKAIARATAKYLATAAAAKQARKQSGDLAGVLVQITGNIVSVMTEQADLRHWRLLPDEIRVARLLVPYGKLEGEIDFVNAAGEVVQTRAIPHFDMAPGGKKFFIFCTVK